MVCLSKWWASVGGCECVRMIRAIDHWPIDRQVCPPLSRSTIQYSNGAARVVQSEYNLIVSVRIVLRQAQTSGNIRQCTVIMGLEINL